MCISKRINWIISEVQVSDFFFHFYSFKTAYSSPGKWNWYRLSFLPFIFIFEQCATLLIWNVKRTQEPDPYQSVFLCNNLHHVLNIFPLNGFLYLPNWQIVFWNLVLELSCCKKRQKRPNQETGLGNRGRLKVLNDTKLFLNEPTIHNQFRINLVSFRTFPYFLNQFLGWDFFCRFTARRL